MRNKTKKIFSIVLLVSMLLAVMPQINIFAAASEMPSGYKGSDGKRYITLSEDVALSSRWVVSENVVLDLNGHAISRNLSSSAYNGEWASNVSIGASGESEGFADATRQTMDFLAEYINKYNIDTNNTKFWVTGYSRTGAVSNMVAKRLIDTYNNDGTKVFAYCNAPANGGLKSEMKTGCDYSGIHNIINPSDIVPYVAPSEMGFVRYGTDHFIPGDTAKTTLDEASSKQIRASLARDNTSYTVGTNAYNSTKDKMLIQLAAVCNLR